MADREPKESKFRSVAVLLSLVSPSVQGRCALVISTVIYSCFSLLQPSRLAQLRQELARFFLAPSPPSDSGGELDLVSTPSSSRASPYTDVSLLASSCSRVKAPRVGERCSPRVLLATKLTDQPLSLCASSEAYRLHTGRASSLPQSFQRLKQLSPRLGQLFISTAPCDISRLRFASAGSRATEHRQHIMATPEMSESAPGPASDAQRALQHHSTPERSHESSGSGVSVIYHPSENGSSFESTFEALRISGDHEPDSSIEFILTPPRAPNVPALVVVDDSMIVSPLPDPVTHMPCASPDDARRRDASSEETTEQTPRPTVLNPLVPPFRAVPISTADEARPLTGHVILARFHSIINDGKNMIGELRLDAKVALADLGLKPIPSLHGSALLPYARNPS